jgi:MoaA/NifB/PqqE/SkfB family radical SAM enzyme
MYDLSSIIEVHLEITSKCSVRCPQCPRNSDLGVTNPNLPEVELRLADVRHIFSEQFLSQLLQITICGNYGDPTAAQDTLAVVEYLRAGNKGVQLQVNSHGSTRSIDWWRDLGAVGVRCHFSIDGLKDTNHVYRRGTHWDAIIRNVRAFIEGGGTAVWEFLVFAHNEHQVQEARALSVSLGVKHFVVKKTVRFMREGRMIADMPMHSKSGTPLGVLSLPTSIQYQNAVLRRMSSEIIGRAEYETYIENTPIRCKAVQKRGIYIIPLP